ncbi:MAG: hypothetical protein JRJ02_14325, partial [Deltaproteobacteria bacterium]|nr:hypothetical protein [Deltaproteobacteria bacterium]
MTKKLNLSLEDNLVPNFFYLLQQGFMVKAQVGFCKQLGVSPEYLEDRIQTIFLDGKPVDHVNSAIIEHGSTLALSAAMPGLLGATLRKGSYYAAMRSQISYRKKTKLGPIQEGMVFLKLFNLLLGELGPDFLKRGIWLDGKILEDFFKGQSNDFWAGCKAAGV